MLVSRYGRATCAWQVGALCVLGAVFAALALALGAPGVAWVACVPLALAAFVLSFYRDPDRQGSEEPDACLSPADGTVTDVATVDEPLYLGGPALRVGIFLSPLNVHVNRAPLAGEVEVVVARPGQCLAATSPRCIDQNRATLLGLRTDRGKVAVRQVTGALARTIVCGARPGDRLGRGERYGMIKLGSRTELLVPSGAGFEPAVQVGDTVRGGATVLGRFRALAAGVRQDGAAGAQATS